MDSLQKNKMKSLIDYFKTDIMPSEGDKIDIVVNEQYALETQVVATQGQHVYIGVDSHGYKVLEAAGLVKEI